MKLIAPGQSEISESKRLTSVVRLQEGDELLTVTPIRLPPATAQIVEEKSVANE